MKSTELRIGNYLQKDLSIDDIIEIQVIVGDLLIIQIEEDMQQSSYFPIPLTEKWLIKFGYVRNKYGTMSKDGVLLSWMGNNKYCFNADSCTNKSIHLEYVHQLQNLHFALTGIEL
jgi:hypothetical protein